MSAGIERRAPRGEAEKERKMVRYTALARAVDGMLLVATVDDAKVEGGREGEREFSRRCERRVDAREPWRGR